MYLLPEIVTVIVNKEREVEAEIKDLNTAVAKGSLNEISHTSK